MSCAKALGDLEGVLVRLRACSFQGFNRAITNSRSRPRCPRSCRNRNTVITTTSSTSASDRARACTSRYRDGALLGGGVGQDHHHEDHAVVLVRHEARGRDAEQPGDRDDEDHHREHDHQRAPDRRGDDASVVVRDAQEAAVERAEEPRDQPVGFPRVARLEQQRAQPRREREGDQRREQRRHGDGERELLVELARDAGHEGHRDEDRAEHQRDGDTGPGDLVHRLAVASRGRRPECMMCSTASTTTMASSTTMPIASTMPNSDSVLILKPRNWNAVKVATSDTGTASIGISVARQLCRNRKTTISTRSNASTNVCTTSSMDASRTPSCRRSPWSETLGKPGAIGGTGASRGRGLERVRAGHQRRSPSRQRGCLERRGLL